MVRGTQQEDVIPFNDQGNIGGLLGEGAPSQIHSSFTIVGEVRGVRFVGGLRGGSGWGTDIVSSSVVAGEIISTEEAAGGLASQAYRGAGNKGWVLSSFAVAGSIRGTERLGGLIGELFASGRVAFSYAVTGQITSIIGSSFISGLVGDRRAGGRVENSYWDRNTSDLTRGDYGSAQNTSDLQSPTNYTGLYDNWDNGVDIDNNGNDNDEAIWCDADHSGSIEADEKINDNRIWDFGTSSQYPAIRCLPVTPAEQRQWWSLDEHGDPQLNQTRLDKAFEVLLAAP